jgi:hypothetical protein
MDELFNIVCVGQVHLFFNKISSNYFPKLGNFMNVCVDETIHLHLTPVGSILFKTGMK